MEVLLTLHALLSQTTEVVTPVIQSGSAKLTDMMMRYETLMVTGAAYIIIQAMQKSLSKFSDQPVMQRLKPFAPIVLCVGMAFLPTFRLPGALWDEVILYGVTIGGTLGSTHKIVSQSVFGKDRRISPYVEDPELRKIIDEFIAAKESGDANAKKSLVTHMKNWLV